MYHRQKLLDLTDFLLTTTSRCVWRPPSLLLDNSPRVQQLLREADHSHPYLDVKFKMPRDINPAPVCHNVAIGKRYFFLFLE
jgi:hypothetical protein